MVLVASPPRIIQKVIVSTLLVLNSSSNHEFDRFELLHLTSSQYTNKKINKLSSSRYTKSTFVIFQLSPLSLPLNDRLLLDNGNQSRLKMGWVDPAMMK